MSEGYPVGTHIGRSWHGHVIEDDCPCGKAPCGLVDAEKVHAGCLHHALLAYKTIRQIHPESDCPMRNR